MNIALACPDDHESAGPDRYFTIKKLAELTQISAKTIRRQVNLGHIQAIRPTASANAPIYIAESEWNRFVNEVAAVRQHVARKGKGVRHG